MGGKIESHSNANMNDRSGLYNPGIDDFLNQSSENSIDNKKLELNIPDFQDDEEIEKVHYSDSEEED